MASAPDIRDAFDFSGRRVIVVGASSTGIGRAVADAFALCGAEVSVAGSRPRPDADAPHRYLRLDVGDPEAVAAFATGIAELDVLVNCAGIARRNAEDDPVTFRRILDINLGGHFHLATGLRPALARRRGTIVGISSVYARLATPQAPAYGASKAALEQLTRTLSVALSPDGVRVNAVAPGFTVTPQTAPARADKAHVARVSARIPMGRWATPADMVGPTLFLASPAAAYVTGAVLVVDGGYSAA